MPGALDSEGVRLRQEVRRVLGSKKLTTAKGSILPLEDPQQPSVPAGLGC